MYNRNLLLSTLWSSVGTVQVGIPRGATRPPPARPGHEHSPSSEAPRVGRPAPLPARRGARSRPFGGAHRRPPPPGGLPPGASGRTRSEGRPAPRPPPQFGYHLGVISLPLAQISEALGFEGDAVPLAAVTTALLAGGWVGAVASGPVADAVGPKRAQLLGNVPMAAGVLLSCAFPAAWTWGTLAAARALVGVGTGFFIGLQPRYVAEISPAEVRGALGVSNAISIGSGVFLGALAGLPYAFVDAGPGGAWGSWWRVALALGAVWVVAMCAGAAFPPESPLWLRGRGRAEEAALVEAWLGLPPGDAADDDTEAGGAPGAGGAPEREGTEGVGPGEPGRRGAAAPQGTFRDLLRPEYRRVMYLGTMSVSLLLLGGIDAVVIFSATLFADAGLGRGMQVVGVLSISLVLLLSNYPALRLMDTAGRRPLMMYSHAGMAVALLAVGATMLSGGGGAGAAYGVLALVVAYCTAFALGVGPVPFIYLSEIMPEEIRGPGMAFAMAVHWLVEIATVVTFPFLVAWWGAGGTFLMYAAFNAAGAAFARFHMVETKQRTLQELTRQLTGASRPPPPSKVQHGE